MTYQNVLRFFSITFIAALFFTSTRAQDSTRTIHSVEVKSLTKLKVYLFGFGLEREQKITKSSTIYFGATIESVVPFYPEQPPYASDILHIDYSLNFAPVIYAGYRNYYNLQHRENSGKKTANNSAGFVGLEYNLIMPILINNRYSTNYVCSFSPIWGFQNSVSKKTNLEAAIGPSIQTDFNKTRISGFAKFGFSFLL